MSKHHPDDYLMEKQLDSDPVIPENEISEDTKPLAANKVADFDYYAGVDDVKKPIELSTRAKVQLTWKDIVITAPPKQGRCGKKIPGAVANEILRGVSGTVCPGQFLSIIGASGKFSLIL